MRNEKGEITFKSFFKWLKSDKGKRYSFFIFYLFFFIFVFIILSFTNNVDNSLNNSNNNSNNDVNNQETNKEESIFPYSIKNIEDTSYDFSFTVNYNESLKEYLGYKNNNEVTIQDDINTYKFNYRNGKLVSESLDYEIENIEFFNIYELKRILKNSKLVSETKITETKEYLYNYTIKTSDLAELLDKDIRIDDDLENEIVVKANSLNEFKEVTLDLVNYFKEINSSDEEMTNYKIVFTYGDRDE